MIHTFCFDRSNDIGLAISYLQQFLSAAEGDSSLKLASSQACSQLGRLFHKIGNFKESVHYYEQHYKLTVELDKESMALAARSQATAAHKHGQEEANNGSHFVALTSDSTALDTRLASIQLGAARADSQLDDLFKQVCDQTVAGIQPLLLWKSSRIKNPNILRPAAAVAPPSNNL